MKDVIFLSQLVDFIFQLMNMMLECLIVRFECLVVFFKQFTDFTGFFNLFDDCRFNAITNGCMTYVFGHIHLSNIRKCTNLFVLRLTYTNC
ncbi:Uncharacterised protein [Mycobacteroides abscessus subsp. abscessus]|nr:Uncharacterised protein [Mycobacteroides abscessus subsp. abscessus]SKN93457.1 Uncharacterised protein [Mycobacteroides abscessus subsp. abscessus]